MTRDQALEKARKALAMGASANPNEAAIAMRQAQALMEKFGIEEAELEEADREPMHEASHLQRGERLPVYTVALGNTVADAFAVRTYTEKRQGTSSRRFVGPHSRACISAYAYTVLLRQLEKDRRQHLKRVRKARNRAARGDAFGIAWVHAIRQLLTAFAGNPDEARIVAYMEKHHPDLKLHSAKARTSKAISNNDYAAGNEAGRKARLHHGVGTAASKPRALGVIHG